MAPHNSKDNSPLSAKKVVKAAIAGGATGAIEISLTFPMEFTKVQMQLQSSRALGNAVAMKDKMYTSAWDCIRTTVKRAGPLGLYVGISPWLVFAVPRTGLRFGVFEYLVQTLNTPAAGTSATGAASAPSNSLTMFAGVTAGMIEGAVGVCPMQTIQIKMSHDAASANPRINGSLTRAVSIIYSEKGFGGFFAGLTPTVLKQGINHGIRFTCVSDFKRRLAEYQKQPGAMQLNSTIESLICGAAAGAISAVVSHPIDTIKSNMQGLDQAKYRSTLHCAQVILSSAGPMGFYKGIGPRITRVCFEVALQFTIFAEISTLLNKVWK